VRAANTIFPGSRKLTADDGGWKSLLLRELIRDPHGKDKSLTVSVKIDGLKQLDDALGELTKATARGVLRRSLKKAAEPMADLANSLAPVGPTGEYAKSFGFGTKLTKRQASQHRKLVRDDKAFVEGFVGTNDPAGVQQEFGNENHGPQPALRPAWDQDRRALVERLGKDLGTEIEKTAQRLARKAARLQKR